MKKLVTLSLCTALLVACFCGGFTASAATAKPKLTFLTKAVYDEVGQYSEGLVWVRQGNTVQYLDGNGKVAISSEKMKILEKKLCKEFGVENPKLIYGDFHNGLALLNYQLGSSIYMFFDKNGVEVKNRGEKPFSFSEGFSCSTSCLAGRIMLTNKKGNILACTDCAEKFDTKGSEHSYEFYIHVTNGLIAIQRYKDDNLISAGYLDTKLNLAIPFKFQNARPFNKGIAPAKSNGKWGFINTKGKFVIAPQFEDFSVCDSKYSYVVFNEGLAAVKKNGKWGYIDTKGNTVIPFKLTMDSKSYPSIFIEGKAIIPGNGKRGYIDAKGRTIIPCIYDDASFFSKGAALVGAKGVYKLIDGTGKNVSSQTWKFQGTMVYNDHPEYVFYKQNGKWGIAKITK